MSASIVPGAARPSGTVARVTPESAILFVCDIQERFREVIHNMEHVIFSAAQLHDTCEMLSIPVIVTEQYPKALKHTVPEIDVKRDNTTVVEKTLFSMITPEVEAALSAHPTRKDAIIVGIEAHVCALQSTYDLIERGYTVHIVADAISSQRALDRSIGIQRMLGAGGQLTSAESMMFELLRSKDHPQFKTVSALCKRERPPEDAQLTTL